MPHRENEALLRETWNVPI